MEYPGTTPQNSQAGCTDCGKCGITRQSAVTGNTNIAGKQPDDIMKEYYEQLLKGYLADLKMNRALGADGLHCT